MCKIPSLKKGVNPALTTIPGVICATYVFGYQIVH